MSEKLFIVRCYTGWEGWIDIGGPVSKDEAQKVWDKHTKNGTVATKYSDGDYFSIFPAKTRMLYTPDFK